MRGIDSRKVPKCRRLRTPPRYNRVRKRIMISSYARVSTDGQSVDTQMRLPL